MSKARLKAASSGIAGFLGDRCIGFVDNAGYELELSLIHIRVLMLQRKASAAQLQL